MSRLQPYWSSRNIVSVTLWPLSLLYDGLMRARRFAHRLGLAPNRRTGAPVIVVDRLTLDDSDPAPLLSRLAKTLRRGGYRPGVACRSENGPAPGRPRRIKPDSDPREAGADVVLLARRCGCPVVADPDLAAAARALVSDYACNVILCDGGLQEYALARAVEIAVFDERARGNGFCWPAGPLRESLSRLRSVDFVIRPDTVPNGEYQLSLHAGQAVNLVDGCISCSLTAFRGELVHAVAAAGEPTLFFDYLKAQGLRLLPHTFANPEELTAGLDLDDDLPVLLTEKAVIVCRAPARERCWCVPVEAELDPELEIRLLARLADSIGKSLHPSFR